MVLGEVLNLPGKWSSYPPHHHPQPEVYFYRFDYPDGFGAGFANGADLQDAAQWLRRHQPWLPLPDRRAGLCHVLRLGHPAPGGDPWDKTRIDDPEHAWLWKADANDHIYPNH